MYCGQNACWICGEQSPPRSRILNFLKVKAKYSSSIDVRATMDIPSLLLTSIDLLLGLNLQTLSLARLAFLPCWLRHRRFYSKTKSKYISPGRFTARGVQDQNSTPGQPIRMSADINNDNRKLFFMIRDKNPLLIFAFVTKLHFFWEAKKDKILACIFARTTKQLLQAQIKWIMAKDFSAFRW